MGDQSLISGSGRSPGEGNGNPLQYSCLENPIDRGAGGLQSMESHKSQTRLNDLHFDCDGFFGKEKMGQINGLL